MQVFGFRSLAYRNLGFMGMRLEDLGRRVQELRLRTLNPKP